MTFFGSQAVLLKNEVTAWAHRLTFSFDIKRLLAHCDGVFLNGIASAPGFGSFVGPACGCATLARCRLLWNIWGTKYFLIQGRYYIQPIRLPVHTVTQSRRRIVVRGTLWSRLPSVFSPVFGTNWGSFQVDHALQLAATSLRAKVVLATNVLFYQKVSQALVGSIWIQLLKPGP